MEISKEYAYINGDTLEVSFWYPRCKERFKDIRIDLIDVRAADDIKVSYDFDKDGWVIKQASQDKYDKEGFEQDEDWQEVAFIKAWGRWRGK